MSVGNTFASPPVETARRAQLAQDKKAEDSATEKSVDSAEAKAQLAVMRQIAEGVKTSVTDGDTQREVELIPNALFRSNDLARNWLYGSVWGFGRQGRPVALLSLSQYRTDAGIPSGWLYEFNSLSSLPIESKTGGGRSLDVAQAGSGLQQDLRGAQQWSLKRKSDVTRQFRKSCLRVSPVSSCSAGARILNPTAANCGSFRIPSLAIPIRTMVWSMGPYFSWSTAPIPKQPWCWRPFTRVRKIRSGSTP